VGILGWIVMGLLAGLVARFIMPGKDGGGIIITCLLGIAGAMVGGFIAHQLGYAGIDGFDLHTFLLAVGGAVLILILYRLIRR
jgi:uncharacterized membrane protein YeaQ/YmgE (transglycosylase-associated protein family)